MNCSGLTGQQSFILLTNLLFGLGREASFLLHATPAPGSPTEDQRVHFQGHPLNGLLAARVPLHTGLSMWPGLLTAHEY